MTIASTGKPPEKTSADEEYKAPFRGFFLSINPQLASFYKPQNEFLLASQIGLFVEHYDKWEKAAYWALKAFDMGRNSGVQEHIGLLGIQAIPILVKENQIALAFDLAFEMQIMFELYKRKISDVADPRSFLGSKPSEHWNSIEQAAAEVSIILAVLRIIELYDQEPELALEYAIELEVLCRQILITASSSLFWEELIEAIEILFRSNISFDEFVLRGNELKEWRSIQFLYYLGASLIATPKEALDIYNAILPLLEGRYQTWAGLYKRIIIPYVTWYWRNVLIEYRHQFLAPDYVFERINDFSNDEQGAEISKLLKAVKFGLDMRV